MVLLGFAYFAQVHLFQGIAEIMRLNVPMAMKIAFERLYDSEYKTRDAVITGVGCFESVELSVLLCNDEFIQKLNKDWRGEDHATDVLSMSQHIPELKLPIVSISHPVIDSCVFVTKPYKHYSPAANVG